MKKTMSIALAATIVLAFASGHAALQHGVVSNRVALQATDDPPPEPITCPLCAGDPLLHARRMFQIEMLSGNIAGALLRW